MAEAGEEGEVIEFKWGKRRGVGGKKKDVQFYESFSYDGVEYSLYDSVFLYKEGEPEHFIGKIVKIWEAADKSKKVKILWYFRPSEILNFLEGSETLHNELFLASGEGEGLVNVNPLEAIAGKCNIVCISKDNRNPYPSDEEVQIAEFVFYRFFDVGKRKIVDKIDDNIAGIEVKNIFNNLDSQKVVGLVKPGLDKKEVNGNFIAIRENADSKSLLRKKPTSSTGVKDAKNGSFKVSLDKQKSSNKLSHGSRAGLEMREITKMDDGCGNVSIEKKIVMSRVDLEGDDCDDVGGPVGKINKGSTEEEASKKGKHGSFGKASSAKMNNKGQNRRLISYDDDDDDDVKTIAPSSSKDKYKHQRDYGDVEELPSKKLKIDKKPMKLTSDKLRKESSMISPNVEHKLDFRPMEVTQRPDVVSCIASTLSLNFFKKIRWVGGSTRLAYQPMVDWAGDRSKWFKEIPWEEKMETAHEQGKLVLLQNLDPSLSSSDVQNIIWTGFKESCTAKMIQKTAHSSPHSGQAVVIFRKKEAAESVVRKLDEGCFLMSNGRPLVGSIGVPSFPEKKPIFYGHHVVDQLRMMQTQREMKDAVSTSHCSQPNNIEYEMAIEWCLLQERASKSWRKLYQRQGEELSKLKAKLKSKV
uniref:BAH domain-containing protein n=1 Tax=Cajanus cajan TaxID=3821 RepID=A0A151TDS8_CAJCA|nr:hypothetical protein KK1_011424 [Cajanus cajan]